MPAPNVIVFPGQFGDPGSEEFQRRYEELCGRCDSLHRLVGDASRKRRRLEQRILYCDWTTQKGQPMTTNGRRAYARLLRNATRNWCEVLDRHEKAFQELSSMRRHFDRWLHTPPSED